MLRGGRGICSSTESKARFLLRLAKSKINAAARRPRARFPSTGGLDGEQQPRSAISSEEDEGEDDKAPPHRGSRR